MSEHVPGQLKYDVCMTEQVSGPQGTKIAGRHMVMASLGFQISNHTSILIETKYYTTMADGVLIYAGFLHVLIK